jgi:hypothetical protein
MMINSTHTKCLLLGMMLSAGCGISSVADDVSSEHPKAEGGRGGGLTGTYTVPTVDAGLADAASFPITSVKWSMVDGVAT